jgi:hypothetical protein
MKTSFVMMAVLATAASAIPTKPGKPHPPAKPTPTQPASTPTPTPSLPAFGPFQVQIKYAGSVPHSSWNQYAPHAPSPHPLPKANPSRYRLSLTTKGVEGSVYCAGEVQGYQQMVSLPQTACENPAVSFSWEYNRGGYGGAILHLEAVVGEGLWDSVARGTYYVPPKDIAFPEVDFPTSRHQVYIGPVDVVVDNVQLGNRTPPAEAEE